MSDTPHYHVAHGLAGYGPDASDSDGFITCDDVRETADAIREELRMDVDYSFETAQAYADAGDYERAWHERARSDALEILRATFDNARQNAPLYRDDPNAWTETLVRLIAETFPLDVSENGRLYVWLCTETDCQSAADNA